MQSAEYIDLDETMVTIYRTMLTHMDWGVVDLAVHLELTENEIRSVLDRLASLSLARPLLNEPARWRAVSPRVGFASIIAKQEADLACRQQELKRSQSMVAGLLADFSTLRPRTDTVEIERIEDLHEVREALQELAAQVRNEVFALVPDGPQRPDVLEESRQLDEVALRRGVRMRTVYLSSVRNDHPRLDYARWLSELGAEVRTTGSIPTRLLVVDRTIAVTPIDPECSRRGAQIIRGAGIVAALYSLAEKIWQDAVPLSDRAVRDTRGLTDREQELLRLLGAGLTDEVAARRLGVSLRTVRRLMANLMRRGNAASRFQAGVQLSRLGWLAPHDPVSHP